LPCPPLLPYTTLFRSIPHHRAAGGGGFVGPADHRGHRGGVEGLRVFLCPAEDLRQHRRRLIQGVGGLGLGGLEHQRLVDDQGERSEEHTSELQSRFDI